MQKVIQYHLPIICLLALVFFISCSDDDDNSGSSPSSESPTATIEYDSTSYSVDSISFTAGGQASLGMYFGASNGLSLSTTIFPYISEGAYSLTEESVLGAVVVSSEGLFITNSNSSGSITITEHDTALDRLSGEYSFSFDSSNGPFIVSGTFTDIPVDPVYDQTQDIELSIDGVPLSADLEFTYEDPAGTGTRVFIESSKDIHESVNIAVIRSTTEVGNVPAGDYFNGPGPRVLYTIAGVTYESTPGDGLFDITSFDPGIPYNQPGSMTMQMNVPLTNDIGQIKTLTGTIDVTYGPE